MTHLTYSFVSARFIFDLGKALGLRYALEESSILVTSRQSRYIMYGSSNLTLKKNDELASYGDCAGSASSPPDRPRRLVGTSVTRVRTTKPSTGSPRHSPLAAQSFVKVCTSLIVSTEVQGVLMNPQRSAKSSTTLGSSVMKCRERTFNPCRCKPVFSGE